MVEIIDGSTLLPPKEPKPEQPTLGQVAERMARVVVLGDAETEDLFARAEQMEAPNVVPDIAAAFERGARLNLPEPGPALLDPALTARPKVSKAKPKTGSRPAGSDELTQLFAAGMITLISFSLGDWALPTAEEATELSRPLANIIARRIDIAAKLGQDANDTIAFAIAIMAYLVRVGPLAADRVKEWNAERHYRTERTIPDRPYDPDRTSGMAVGDDAGPSAPDGAAYHPRDAIAQARDLGLGVLDRDFDYATGRNPALGH